MELKPILGIVIALAGFGFWYSIDCLRDYLDERKRKRQSNNLEMGVAMKSLKTAFVGIVVAAGILFGIYHREPKHALAPFIIFSLYCLVAGFYDWRKARRALKKNRQEIDLEKTAKGGEYFVRGIK